MITDELEKRNKENALKANLVKLLRKMHDIGLTEAIQIVGYWWAWNTSQYNYVFTLCDDEVASLCLLASKVVRGEWVWDGEDIVKRVPLQREDYAVTL